MVRQPQVALRLTRASLRDVLVRSGHRQVEVARHERAFGPPLGSVPTGDVKVRRHTSAIAPYG